VSPADSPIYQAVRAYQAGQRGALPLHRAWSALEASSCDPACQYGTCVKVKKTALHYITLHYITLHYITCSIQPGVVNPI
jgi:hypothetical protein